jgi:hypothetical protein
MMPRISSEFRLAEPAKALENFGYCVYNYTLPNPDRASRRAESGWKSAQDIMSKKWDYRIRDKSQPDLLGSVWRQTMNDETKAITERRSGRQDRRGRWVPQLRYHHIGIPTDRPLPEEDYIAEFKAYASGYAQSPYGIEWMRFEPGSPLPELVKAVPHVAFVVEDIRAAIEGKQILIAPNSPADGVTVAFIVDNGAPVEFLQFDRPEAEVWPEGAKFK